MKRTFKIIALLLALSVMICFFGCNRANKTTEELWRDAVYTEDTEIGEGSKSVKCIVEAGDKKITLTLRTEEKLLGSALFKNKVTNHESFFNEVNGIVADWDADGAYWAFYVDGKYAEVGVAKTEIKEGESYSLVYTTDK